MLYFYVNPITYVIRFDVDMSDWLRGESLPTFMLYINDNFPAKYAAKKLDGDWFIVGVQRFKDVYVNYERERLYFTLNDLMDSKQLICRQLKRNL